MRHPDRPAHLSFIAYRASRRRDATAVQFAGPDVERHRPETIKHAVLAITCGPFGYHTLGPCLGRTGEELGPCQLARKTLRTTSCHSVHRQVLRATHCERAWKRLFRPALLAGSAAAITQRFPVDRRLTGRIRVPRCVLVGFSAVICSVTAGALTRSLRAEGQCTRSTTRRTEASASAAKIRPARKARWDQPWRCVDPVSASGRQGCLNRTVRAGNVISMRPVPGEFSMSSGHHNRGLDALSTSKPRLLRAFCSKGSTHARM
jgi:hypothetical protein